MAIIRVVILAFASAGILVAQSASFTWGFSSENIEDSSGEYIEGGTAFFYLGLVGASSTAFDFSAATFIASAGQNDSTYNYGMLNINDSGYASSDLISTTEAGQAFSLILVEGSGVSSLSNYSGNYILYNGTSTEGPLDVFSGQKFAAFVDATDYTASAWKNMSATPEPTSAILLLSGVAGLLLKRRNGRLVVSSFTKKVA